MAFRTCCAAMSESLGAQSRDGGAKSKEEREKRRESQTVEAGKSALTNQGQPGRGSPALVPPALP